MTHARCRCCNQDCVLESSFVAEFGAASITISNQWNRTTVEPGSTTVAHRTTTGTMNINPMRLGFQLRTPEPSAPNIQFYTAECGKPNVSNAELPIGASGIFMQTIGGTWLDGEDRDTSQSEFRFTGIRGVAFASTPVVADGVRDFHRLTYLLIGEGRTRTIHFSGDWNPWSDWVPGERFVDIVFDHGSADGTTKIGNVPMKCGAAVFVPASDHVIEPNVAVSTGQQRPQTRPIAQIADRVIHQHHTLFAPFFTARWQDGMASIPGGFSHVWESSTLNQTRTDTIASTVNANITANLRNRRDGEPTPYCPGAGGLSGAPPGSIKTGTRDTQPGNGPGTRQRVQQDQDGNSTRFGVIDPEHDPATEAKALQQGGDCGCSSYTHVE